MKKSSKKSKCVVCGNPLTGRQRKFCSSVCEKDHWKLKTRREIKRESENCVSCGTPLTGRQRKYCSTKCKNDVLNPSCQSVIKQQERGLERKNKLIELAGGGCEICGYKKNIAALEFHHRNPEDKKMSLSLRTLSNNRWSLLLAEFKKCALYCANCHREVHNPSRNN